MKRTLLALPVVLTASCTTIYFDFYTYKVVGTTSTGGTGGGGGTTSTGGAGGALLCAPGATQPCYDGPAGTEGVGLCTSGTQTCAPDGASWGACAGEVVPQTENCATPEDEDCDGQAPACKGALLWAKRFGDVGDQHVNGIAADAAGNVLVAGTFSGSIDFGGGPLVSVGASSGPTDVFVAKLDPSGAHLWSKRAGDPKAQSARAIAVDGAGNVLLTGTFAGTIDFGGGALASAGGLDVFVAKLAPDGSVLWSERFGGPGDEEPFGIAVADGGAVWITGRFGGTIDFGGGPLIAAGGTDIFAAKLDAAGAHLWSARFGDGSDQVARGIAVGTDGGPVITGDLAGSVDFGGGAQVAVGEDAFVACFDASGAPSWSVSFGDAYQHSGRGVARAANGDVVVAGYFLGSMDLGGGPLVSAGLGDIFVTKRSAAGAYQWGARFGDASDQAGQSVAVDPGGNVLLTGYIAGAADFGGGPLASAGGADAFIAKLDAGGGHVWSKRFGDQGNQYGTAIATDPVGNVLAAGQFAGTIDFGGGPLVTADGLDAFVAKFGP
jgi:hypothetical protein